MNKIAQDIEQIKKTLEIFKRDNGLFELRTFLNGRPKSGYFKDIDNMLKVIKNSRETFYFVLNEINEDCYKREAKEKMLSGEATKNDDIIARNWILIDCDVETPVKGISSTDDEKELSLAKSRQIYKFLKSNGFADPVMADSGNGYHLLYKVQMNTEKCNTDVVQDFLKALDMLFSDKCVKVDKSVHNTARVTKLYGTLMQKGNDEPDRPHRLSKIIYTPEEINITGLSYVKKIAELLPKPEPKVYNNRSYINNTFDLREFIYKHGIRVKSESNYSDGTRFILDECVFNSDHKGKDAAIFLRNDGVIGYKCFHNSCSEYQWRDVRLKFEPDAYDDKNQTNGYKHVESSPIPNYRKREYKPLNFEEIMKKAPKIEGTEQAQPIFYTTEQIRAMPKKAQVFIKTGIYVLDKKIRGLEKGKITMLLGESGSGKSSLISQLVLEASQQDFRTGYFSGELECTDAYEWLILQAAGKQYVRKTDWENYFVPNEESEILISKWLDNKMFLYNNRYGNKFEFIKENLGKIIKDKKLDFIILDNLMSMDISDLAYETNAQQTEFVVQLKDFAATNDVHILFVAHQRKINDFRLAGKYDNCGSSNLINYVDNQFIIYRVNETYKKLKAKEFHIDEKELDGVGNELRCSKNRKGGLDMFIPLYFEMESKRLKNYMSEMKFYNWEKPYSPYDDNSNLTEVTSEDDLPI